MRKFFPLVVFLFLLSCSKTVEVLPDQVGIIVDENIIDTTKVIYLGKYKLNRNQDIIYFDISNQEKEFKNLRIELKDSTQIDISFKVYFHPVYEKAPILYKLYENDYVEKLLKPKIHDIINKKSFNIDKSSELNKDLFATVLYERIKAENNYNRLIKILDLNIINFDVSR